MSKVGGGKTILGAGGTTFPGINPGWTIGWTICGPLESVIGNDTFGLNAASMSTLMVK